MKMMGRESLERLAEYSSPGPSTSSSSIRKTRRVLAELSKETLSSLATTLSDSDEDSDIDEESIKKEFENVELVDLDRKEARLEKRADKTRLKLKKKMEEKLKKVKSSEKADELTTIKTRLRILREVKAAKKGDLKEKTRAYLVKMKKNGTMDKWNKSLAAKKERDQLRDEANGIEKKKGIKLKYSQRQCLPFSRLNINHFHITRGRNLSNSKAGFKPQKRCKGRKLLRRRQPLPPYRWGRSPRKYTLDTTRFMWDILFHSEKYSNIKSYDDISVIDVFADTIDMIKDDDIERPLNIQTSDDTIVSIFTKSKRSDLTYISRVYRPVSWTFVFQAESNRRDRAQEETSNGFIQKGQWRTGTRKDHGHSASAADPPHSVMLITTTTPKPSNSSYFLPIPFTTRHCTELPGLSPDALT